MSDLIITQPGPTELVIEQGATTFLGFQGSGLPGAPGRDAAGISPVAFGRGGTMYLSTGGQRFRFPYAFTALQLVVDLGSPPVGADFVLVLNRNSAPWVTATVPDGQSTVSVPINQTIVPDDYLTIDITSVGSTSAGAELTATLWTKALAA